MRRALAGTLVLGVVLLASPAPLRAADATAKVRFLTAKEDVDKIRSWCEEQVALRKDGK